MIHKLGKIMQSNKMMTLSILIIILFSSLAYVSLMYAQPSNSTCNEIVYANIIMVNNKKIYSQYLRVVDNKLIINPGNSTFLMVRVTSTSPIKPYKIFINNQPIIPKLSSGIILTDDVFSINFTKLGYKGTVVVHFRSGIPKKSVFLLKEGNNYIEIKKPGNITLDRNVWGVILIIISYDKIDISSVLDAKYMIYSFSIKNITTEVGVIHEYTWKVLITSHEFSIKEIPSKILKIVYRKIYIYDVDIINFDNNIYEINNNTENSSIYINIPYNYKITFIENKTSNTFLSKLFNFYFPRIYNTKKIIFKANVYSSLLRITYPNGTLYKEPVYINDNSYKKIVNNGEIVILSNFMYGNISVSFVLGNENIGCYKIYGLPEKLTIKAPLYRVKVFLEDLNGINVSNAILEIYRSFTKKAFNVSKGVLDLGYLPSGRYIFKVTKNGIEIGRKIVDISSNININIVCNLINLKYKLFKVNGVQIHNFTFYLIGMGLNKKFVTSTGSVTVSQIIPGKYKYLVILNNRTIINKVYNIYPNNSSIIDIVDLPNLQVKIVNFFGNPLKGVEIDLFLKNYTLILSKKSDQYGKVVFEYLNKGFYIIEIPSFKYKETIKLENDKNIIVRTDAVLILDGVIVNFNTVLYLFLLLVLLFLIIFAYRMIKARKDEIILDIEDKGGLHET